MRHICDITLQMNMPGAKANIAKDPQWSHGCDHRTTPAEVLGQDCDGWQKCQTVAQSYRKEEASKNH